MLRFLHTRLGRGVLASLSLALVFGLASCGSGDPTDPDPPSISIALSPASGTVEQGGSLTVTGSATLGGSFAGVVDFTVAGLPAGVAYTAGPLTTSGNVVSAPLTVEVASSVAPGTYPVVVTASGSGVSAQTDFSLTVEAAVAGTFALGSISAVSIEQGGSGTRDVDIDRSGGFAGDVTLTVEGLPGDVTASASPATTGAASSTITITVGGGAATGSSTLTVRGTATGLPDATTTIALTVTAPSSGTDIVLDYSMCPMDEQPTWFAFQDGAGSGPWVRVTGVSHVYEAAVTGATFGFAAVFDTPSQTDLSVDYFGVAQLDETTIDACPPPGGKFVGGTAAGVVGFTNLSLGGSSTLVFSDGLFSISAVPDGPQDFVGYSLNTGGGSDRMVIERDLDIDNGGSLGSIDFTTEGFDPASATITLTGLAMGVSGLSGMAYASTSAGGVCTISPLHQDLIEESFEGRSAPASEQMSDEFHVVTASADLGDRGKHVSEAFGTLADRNIAMPADLPTPTLTDVTGGADYLRLQAEYELPAEYGSLTFFDYSFDSWNMTIFAVGEAMSTDVSFAMPDFTGVDGWDDVYAIPAAATGVEYVISATGLTDRQPLCTEGGRHVSSALSGSYN